MYSSEIELFPKTLFYPILKIFFDCVIIHQGLELNIIRHLKQYFLLAVYF